ncbi:MAG: peptidoglycan-associated lipoprotein [Motiliproteus sp.]|jgi:peptidoglycan-associated lipoprotein
MRVRNISKAVAVAATLVWISGCTSTGTTTDSTDAASAGQDSTVDSATSTATGSDTSMQSGQMTDKSMAEAAVADLQTVFYFDFDKTVIEADAFEDLSAHAKFLSAYPEARIVLEGHADERGTREYNMALGERRAKAVSRFLAVQGAASNQIEVVSYGEERPAMMGHDENSWGQNRRVELKYSH